MMRTTENTTKATTQARTNSVTTGMYTTINTAVMDTANMDESDHNGTAMMETATQFAAVLLATGIVNYAELLVKKSKKGKNSHLSKVYAILFKMYLYKYVA